VLLDRPRLARSDWHVTDPVNPQRVPQQSATHGAVLGDESATAG
jgi:hypothetical protein